MGACNTNKAPRDSAHMNTMHDGKTFQCYICLNAILRYDDNATELGCCNTILHTECFKQLIQNKLGNGGKKITLNQLGCIICKKQMIQKSFTELLKPLNLLYDAVKNIALHQLKLDKQDKCFAITNEHSEFYNNPIDYAIKIYSIYMCNQCQNIYYGGLNKCNVQIEDDINCENILCSTCLNLKSIAQATRAEFVQSSIIKKKHFNQFPTLNEYIENKENKDSKLIKQILSDKPSGDLSSQDTIFHVLNASSNHDNVCLDFVLTLNQLDACTDNDDQKSTGSDKLIELKKCITNKVFNPIIDDIQTKLSKIHEIDKNRIIITDIYEGSVNIPYKIADLTQNEKDKFIKTATKIESKMNKLFKFYDKLSIHPALLHETYYISMFDKNGRGNIRFGWTDNKTFSIGPRNNQKEYKQPTGWARYGLSVIGKYNDDKWLHPFQDPGNWYRAYHGTNRDGGASIYNTGFWVSDGKNGTRALYGPGVYCSPNIETAKQYARNVTIPTKNGIKKFAFVLQVAVNPQTLNNTKTGGPDDYWIAPTSNDIRPYGILIKEIWQNYETNCQIHGQEYITWKCRWCCSLAGWMCMGTHHICDNCHTNFSVMINKERKSSLTLQCPYRYKQPQISVAGYCPLGIAHPDHGNEYSFGCSMCRCRINQ